MWATSLAAAASSLLAVFHRQKYRDQTAVFNECSTHELARMARETGMTVSELRQLSKLGSDAAKLLFQRMSALHLDRNSTAKTYPAAMRDLQRLCSQCISKKRCQRDLAYDRYNPAWRQYCPNAGTLEALQCEPTATRSTELKH